MGKPLYTSGQFIAAIPGTGGIITAIAKKVGADWHTTKKYIHLHPTVKAAYDAECEGVLDLAEAKLIMMIQNGEAWAVKYILSTKGRKRGYVERQEVAILDWRDELTRKVLAGELKIPEAIRIINDSNLASEWLESSGLQFAGIRENQTAGVEVE